MGSRWAAPAVLGVVTMAAAVLGGATAANATKPTLSASCGTPNDTVVVGPTVHAEETVDIFIDGVLFGDDKLPANGPFTFNPPHASQHDVFVKYVNGSFASATVAVPACEQVAETTIAASTTVATTVASSAPTTAVVTTAPTSAVPDQPTSSEPTPSVPAVVVTTVPSDDVDLNEAGTCVVDADGNVFNSITGEPCLAATGSSSGTLLLVASLCGAVGAALLIIRRRPAGN